MPITSASFQAGGGFYELPLEGLITNDMRHFDDGAASIYTMFLNNKGRILYDAIIHKWKEEHSYLVECDKQISDLLCKHLKVYRLKKKIDIEDISRDFNVLALISPTDPASSIEFENVGRVNYCKDPRLSDLGYRVLAQNVLTVDEIGKIFGDNVIVYNDDREYKYLRYKLGVSEGVDDLSVGSSFPLEANCDFLNGVSFQKGCYIGQELTARVHHTGVIRKRFMPLKFDQHVEGRIHKDDEIVANNNTKLNLGKIKGTIREYALGLVKTKGALETGLLAVDRYKAEVIKPIWWPTETPKDKLTL
ncbi:Putative transferase CAF17 homolog, mitochondrial [Eumeta japonica]|uniref:Transferase CAF17 homolog, mitochondrial n=1 Tax=Eumeta variegata TaxID=151549 RepID=A0A4C1XNC0_EUMVA|nr:Putative transferase CAF17 homolog, mitochondrial [Eumeta japonica]